MLQGSSPGGQVQPAQARALRPQSSMIKRSAAAEAEAEKKRVEAEAARTKVCVRGGAGVLGSVAMGG